MRPTSPEREAARLYAACASYDDVRQTFAALVDDVTHAEDVGYGLEQALALRAAFAALLARCDLTPES